MKLLILGCGGMGRYAAKTASTLDFIEELTVADLDLETARRLASALGTSTHAAGVDVTDRIALEHLLRRADVVLNTVGPFFRFGPPVLRAALAAGCHYLDINDDWESTVAMLDMDAQARAAGIAAVIGMGASPGISNLLAVTAAAELDQLEELYAGFDLDAAMPETRASRPSAASVHGVHQLTGTIRIFDGGRFVEQAPMRAIALEYPGLGSARGWTMGHPEAITFPRYFPQLRRALVLMTMSPTSLRGMRALRFLVDAGLISVERAASWVEWLEGVGKPVKTVGDYIAEISAPGSTRLPPLFALARGRKGGHPAAVAATILSAPPAGMGGATGVPLATALACVRPDHSQMRGVFAPEAIVDPGAFFDRLAPLCDPIRRDRHDLLLVSRSWEARDLRAELRQLAL